MLILENVHAVDQDAPFRWPVQPREQLYKRGLARAVEPDDGDLFAAADLKGNVAQHELVAARITEGHMLEADGSHPFRERQAAALVRLIRQGEEFKERFKVAERSGDGHRIFPRIRRGLGEAGRRAHIHRERAKADRRFACDRPEHAQPGIAVSERGLQVVERTAQALETAELLPNLLNSSQISLPYAPARPEIMLLMS